MIFNENRLFVIYFSSYILFVQKYKSILIKTNCLDLM